MFAFTGLSLPLSRLFTLTLLHFLWQGFAIAFLLLAAVALCRIRRPTARYACSLVALVAITASPLITLALLATSQTTSPPPWATPDGIALPLPTTVISTASWFTAAEPVLLTAWLCGVALLSARLLTGALGIARLRRGCQPVPAHLATLVSRLGQRLQLDAASLVVVSHHVTDALALGLLRPLVLIPASWITEMPLSMLEAVIAHELAHLARRDLWVNLLQRLVETILFYHPAVWWLSRRLRIERELCADELAIAATGKRLEYAQALEHIAGERLADIRPALAAFLRGENDMRLLERVRNVLDQRPPERSRLWPAGLAALALPITIWAAASFFSSAIAADDQDQPAIKRPRAAEARRADTRRDGDLKESKRVIVTKIEQAGLQDDEIRSRREAEPAEVREERYTIIRDGQPAEERIERVVIARDGKPLAVDIERPRRDASSERRLDELTSLVKQLSQNVERLQDEIAQLRGHRPKDQPAPERLDQKPVPVKVRPSAENSDGALLERAIQQERDRKETAKRDVEARVRAVAAETKESVRRDAETHARAVARQAQERAEQARHQAEAAARAASDQAQDAARNAKSHAQAIERAIPAESAAPPRKPQKRASDTPDPKPTSNSNANSDRQPAADSRLLRPGTTIDLRGKRGEEFREERDKVREQTREAIEKLEQKLRELKEGQIDEVSIDLDETLNPLTVQRLIRQQQSLLASP